MPTLLERLRNARPEFTGREQKIATALETGYPHAGLQSATALGLRVGVSAATVCGLPQSSAIPATLNSSVSCARRWKHAWQRLCSASINPLGRKSSRNPATI